MRVLPKANRPEAKAYATLKSSSEGSRSCTVLRVWCHRYRKVPLLTCGRFVNGLQATEVMSQVGARKPVILAQYVLLRAACAFWRVV